MEDKTYECTICKEINHVSRLHCKSCGTIPACYSILNAPAKQTDNLDMYSTWNSGYISVLVAWGAERQVSRRTIKRTARTVQMDYYAEV